MLAFCGVPSSVSPGLPKQEVAYMGFLGLQHPIPFEEDGARTRQKQIHAARVKRGERQTGNQKTLNVNFGLIRAFCRAFFLEKTIYRWGSSDCAPESEVETRIRPGHSQAWFSLPEEVHSKVCTNSTCLPGKYGKPCVISSNL